MLSPISREDERWAAKNKTEYPKQNSYVFKVGFVGKPEKPIETVAYLFGRAGRLLATSPLRGGQAEFKASDLDLDLLRQRIDLLLEPPPCAPKNSGTHR